MDNLKLIVDSTDYKIYKTKIDGLLVFERPLYKDERGFYQEFARTPAIEEVLGRKLEIKQWSLSYNKPGVLRGLHAEPQDKIITPMTGHVFMAIADIRSKSNTFGEYESFDINLEDTYTPRKTFIVSSGLANSFMTLGSIPVEYFYAVSEVYKTSEGKRAIRWNDPDINIKWPETPKILSDADANVHPFLRDVFPEKFK